MLQELTPVIESWKLHDTQEEKVDRVATVAFCKGIHAPRNRGGPLHGGAPVKFPLPKKAKMGLDFTATGTGTCAVGITYAAGQTCTVGVRFKPMFAGARLGAVVLHGGSTGHAGNCLFDGTRFRTTNCV